MPTYTKKPKTEKWSHVAACPLCEGTDWAHLGETQIQLVCQINWLSSFIYKCNKCDYLVFSTDLWDEIKDA